MTGSHEEALPRAATSHRIAMVGSGPVGISIAKQLISIGHQVTISNSRGPESLQKTAQDIGATAMTTERAVSEAEVVILGVPMKSIPALRPLLQASLRPDSILVDCGNYYPSRDGHIDQLDEGVAESVWVSEVLSRPVVKVFNSIIATHIASHARPKGSPLRSALPVAGNGEKSKTFILNLVEEIGFDAFDAGNLEDSWRQQPGEPAYCTEPSLGELPRLLARANHAQAAKKRDKAKAIMDKLPADFDSEILLRVSRWTNGMDRFKFHSYTAALRLGLAIVVS